jgi:hypothetical protein
MTGPNRALRVAHVYEHDARKFEDLLNELLARIVASGGVVGDIKYASDSATSHDRRGGFGALVIYEKPLAE